MRKQALWMMAAFAVLMCALLAATFTDDFNRANSESLGANWTESETSGTKGLSIVSNELETDVDINDGGIALYDQSVENDQYSQAVYRGFTSNGCQSGPSVRMSGTVSSGSGYGLTVNEGAGNIKLIKWVNQQIHNQNGTALAIEDRTMTVGEVVRVEAEGSTVRVLIDEAEVISVTDSDVSSGSVGMVAPIFDFAAAFRGRWDDWEGGDLGGGGPTLAVKMRRWMPPVLHRHRN